jgi:hypothetical protein
LAAPFHRLHSGRYSRYKQQVGSGRFKNVFKGFDEKQGIDVAWSKIEADDNNLNHEQMKKIVDDISYGLGLDHPHVIKVHACSWEQQYEVLVVAGKCRQEAAQHRTTIACVYWPVGSIIRGAGWLPLHPGAHAGFPG